MTLLQRVLFVAWRSTKTGGIHPVARLVQRDTTPYFEFVHLKGAEAAVEEGSTPFIEFPRMDRIYESDSLFPLFTNRLMSPKRPEYTSYIERLGLPESIEAPIPILSRSAGRRETDKIEVFGFPSFDPQRNRFVYHFFLRGVRHMEGAGERVIGLKKGEQLRWVRQPDNPVSSLAIVVHREGIGALGWVPATLSEDFNSLLQLGSEFEVFVEKYNPAPDPVHERLLCRLEATSVKGFLPFAGDEYEPIPVGASVLGIKTTELIA